MNWICATCGKPNGAASPCPDCGQSYPDYTAQRALLGPVLNVNYGVINYNLAPTVLAEPAQAPALPPVQKVRGALATVGLLVLGTVVSIVVFFALLAAVV